jgi:methylmalonyl-CoA/ethylmalonyl-CoA epimerase
MAAGPPFPRLRYHHACFSVPDLEASIAWYERVLGFTVEVRHHIAAVPADMAMLRRGPLRIELFHVTDAKPLPEERRQPNSDHHTHGNKHVGFAVDDIDAFIADVTARGAEVAMQMKAPFARFAFIRDNSGNLVEFIEQHDLWPEGASG